MNDDREADEPTAEGARITFNATARGHTALNKITAASGGSKTDSINYSLRSTSTLLDLSHPDGTVHVIAPDGAIHIVHLP